MADKITWVRPSGSEITTNGSVETIAAATGMGWKPKVDAAPEPAPKPKLQANRYAKKDE